MNHQLPPYHPSEGGQHGPGEPGWAEHFLDWSEEMFESNSINPGSVGSGRGQQGHPAHNYSQQQLEEQEQARKKISDAVTYGPRFIQIFEAFHKHLNKPIDIKRHLMALCTDYLIDFTKWARDSDNRVLWISALLLENDYLRPEVRNGIIMVLIYTFASIKATVADGLDMFLTLQDNDTGLGIANRFSLKIYNDPLNCLSFLKISLSALIDAGAIPDNERLNQPKKNKMNLFNKAEVEAFQQLQQMLLGFLDNNELIGGKNFITHVNAHWQMRGKVVRNKRFSSALQAVQGIPLASFASPSFIVSEGMMPLVHQTSDEISVDSDNDDSLVAASAPTAAKRPNGAGSEGPRKLVRADSGQSIPMAAPAHVPKAPKPMALYALRFEKIGLNEWEIRETRWFDTTALIDGLTAISAEAFICFLDETCLVEEMATMKLTCSNYSLTRGSLIRELQLRKALITTWPSRELNQFASFVHLWQESDQTMHTLWRKLQPKASAEGTGKVGYIAYESVNMIGIIVRANGQLQEDIWCSIYPNELQAEDNQQTMGQYLINLFPQLTSISSMSLDRTTLRYYAHKGAANGQQPQQQMPLPAKPAGQFYQTIGTLASPAMKVLGRLSGTPLFHDIVLESL